MTLIRNLAGYDILIFILAGLNGWIFVSCRNNADKVYSHFNKKDSVSNLADRQKEALSAAAGEEKTLTVQDLLTYREQTNRDYARFTNVTSIFPLAGMLGTVISLISVVDQIGGEISGAFFGALTTTFWGIVFAIGFKGLDSLISYKIDDNEKHLEYLFNPDRGRP
jgi:biopolymer transport protein ExbB/TolQ